LNVLKAIHDEHLFRPFLGKDLTSWKRWAVALRALYGLPLKNEKQRNVLRECTGREPRELPKDGFRTALFLTGRRSGKSRIAAVIAGYEALFGGHEKKLAPGEIGMVAVVSPTRHQSSICWSYLQGLFESSTILRNELTEVKDSAKQIALANGLQIAVLTGDPKKVRGFTLVAAIVDEIAFFGLDEESSVRSDVELVRAIRPSLATTNGRLICISSPYARRGYCFSTYQRFHGECRGKTANFSPAWTTLLWKAPSRTMNPTLSGEIVDAAVADDPAAARSEYFGEFRDDVAAYVPRSLIESLVERGRKELLPDRHTSYAAFCDLSGGRNDDAALAVAHREGRKVILDLLRVWRAPFNPYEVIEEMAEELKRNWKLKRVTGDNYSADFTASAFASSGIRYTRSEKPKSKLYLELMPILCSAEIELLDDERLISQLAGLERRTRAGGHDIIDHPPGGHDDMANVVAGVSVCLARTTKIVGRALTAPARFEFSDPLAHVSEPLLYL
jgi:hypothetical protein